MPNAPNNVLPATMPTVPEIEVPIDISDAFDADADVASDFADDLAEPEKKDVVEPEIKPAETKEAVDKKTKYQLKIKGVEEEVELTQPELIAWLQKGKHADQRYSEAAEVERQSKELFKLFKDDPYAAMKAMGHDPDKLAEELVYTKARRSLMSAEERAKVSLEEELAELRAKNAEHEAQNQKGEVSRLESTIGLEITEALKKEGLPDTRELRRTIVRYMLEADNAGHEVGAAEVLPYALADYKYSLAEMFGAMEVDGILDFLGTAAADKVRKAAAVKKTFTTPVPKDRQGDAVPKRAAAPKFYDPEEFTQSL